MMVNKRSTSLYKLLSLLWQHPWLLLGLLLATLGQVGLTVYLPVLIGQAMDSVLAGKGIEFLSLLLQMAGVIVLTSALQWLHPLLANRLVYQLMAKLREQVYAQVHRLPLAYLDGQSIGDLVARIASDSEQVSTGLLLVFQQFFLGVLTIVLTIFSMAKLDGLMMLVVVGLTPLSLLVAHRIARKSYHYYRAQAESRGRQAQLLEESIRQLTLIQVHHGQVAFSQAFSTCNEIYAEDSQRALFASSTINPTTRFINALIYAILAGLGALRIMSGQFTVGALTTFLNYASQYSKPFNDISSVLSELQSALAGANRLFDLLEQPVEEEKGSLNLGEEKLAGQIEFQQVTFSYRPNQPLINDVSVTIPAGSKVAIVGSTGAGKSTLIHLLLRFYEVESGEIRLDGESITSYSREALRSQVGMVLQDTWLKSGTVHDVIAYGCPTASREQVVEAAEAANADFFIRQLPAGYDTYLDKGGASLSQGQRQLLSIARIFLQHPPLLIVDEATSSIDTRTETLIQQAFARLMDGRTSLIIAHRLATIQVADLILVMEGGRIVEQGSHAELMEAKGLYYRMQRTSLTGSL